MHKYSNFLSYMQWSQFGDYFTDIILPYLNNTVDSPIASQCPSTSSQSSGTGDVDINNLLDDVSHCLQGAALLKYFQHVTNSSCAETAANVMC